MKNKGMYRLLSGVLCTSVLLSSQAYAAASADYSDFPQNWSKDAMEFAVKNNFITGVSEDKIAPKAALTRAQLAAILSRAMKTGAGDVSVLDNFTDADKNAWYAGSMAKAVELNILYGDGDSIYPDRPVTRQELFAILVRAFAVTGGDESTLASYNDAGSISSWAKAAISAMIAQGYASGYEDKTLRPTQQVTREEFAQLLYRMQEFYGSSAASDDKNKEEAKADEAPKTNTKKTSGGGGSSSGGGSHSGGGSNSGSTATAEAIVDAEKAVVESTDMGTWLPLAFKDGYSIEKVTSVTVDGTDVTAKLSKVTTDGTIAKLPLVGTPKQVVIKSGGKTQTINLNGSGAASVYAGTQYLPKYVWAHGAVAAWDYYLTNYDKDGNVRINPARTTFNLTEEANAHPYYSPDAEVKDGETFGEVVGNVTIMFNFNTDEEKAWFNGINKLELVEYNENKNTINSNLTYTSAGDVAHYNNKVGELTIPIGQSNFRNNGRYYVRVKSNGGDKASVLVPIHVVNEKAPTLLLRETAVSGRNLHFDVKDMTYAITTPIESVTLTDPKGDTKELRYINDYFLFGDLFVLYNDVNAEEGVNNLPYNGNYTITIRSNGFKEFSKSFKVTGGEDVSSKQAAVVYQSAAYDVMTHATGSGSGGGSSDSSGGYMVSADLLFDSDLLANALLLEEMNVECAAAKKVVDNWYNVICDAVFNQGDTTYNTHTGYLNAVNDAKVAGAEWLGYAEYIAAGDVKTTPNRPSAVKEVLEDGLLGDIQHSNTYGRLEAPKATVGETKENEDVEITFENADAYMGKITKLYLNDNWQELRTDAYTIEGNKITIKAGTLKIGENKITVDATGYLSNVVTIEYAKETEQDLSLSVATPIKEGDDVVITVTNSTKGDFLKNLTGVVLKNSDGTEDKVYYKDYEGGNAVYYVVSEDGKTITLKNVESGTYTVSVSANYYEALTTKEFTVERTTPLTTAPTVKAHEKKEKDNFLESVDYYRLTFSGLEGKDLDTYLGAITKVTVGTKAYTEATSIYFQNDNYRTKIADSTYGGYKDALDLAVNGIDAEKGTLITVEAKGYKTMTYTLKGDSATTDPGEDDKLTAPTVEKAELTTKSGFFEDCDYYRLRFGTISGTELTAYLNKVTGVTVNGGAYTKESTYMKESTFRVKAENDAYGAYAYDILDLAVNGVDTTKDTVIVITAEGYDDVTYTIAKTGGSGGSTTDPSKPETPASVAVDNCVFKAKDASVFGENTDYYRLTFKNLKEAELHAYINAVTSVEVDGAAYSEKEYFSFKESQFRKTVINSAYGSMYDALDLAANGVDTSKDVKVVIKATGYDDLTYTIEKTGGSSDGKDNNKDDNKGDNSGLTVASCTYVASAGLDVANYTLMFEGWSSADLKEFLSNIKEVTVDGKTYDKKVLFLENSQYTPAESDGRGYDSLKLAANGFKTSGDTKIVIKGTLNGKEITIEYTFTA
ncbi:hemoblobin-interacting domain-containing protein [Anaerotignum faecicola]